MSGDDQDADARPVHHAHTLCAAAAIVGLLRRCRQRYGCRPAAQFGKICYSGVIHNSKFTGDIYGNKFLHLVNFDDYGDSIFLDFDRKMGKEKSYETTIPRKLIDCCETLSNGQVNRTVYIL